MLLALGLFEGAPSGNVIAYNYITKLYYNDNQWCRHAIIHHGAHPLMNLIEGNFIEGSFSGDTYWGTGSHTTFFRNRQFHQTNKMYGTFGVWLMSGHHSMNVVGNILGSSEDDTYELATSGKGLYDGEKAVYCLGYYGFEPIAVNLIPV